METMRKEERKNNLSAINFWRKLKGNEPKCGLCRIAADIPRVPRLQAPLSKKKWKIATVILSQNRKRVRESRKGAEFSLEMDHTPGSLGRDPLTKFRRRIVG